MFLFHLNSISQMWDEMQQLSSVSVSQRWERSWEDGGGQVYHGLHLQSIRRWSQSPGESCSFSVVPPPPLTHTRNIMYAASAQDVGHSPHAWVQWTPHMFFMHIFTLWKAAPFLLPPSTLYFSLVGLQTGRCLALKPNRDVMFDRERPTTRWHRDL